MQFIIWLVWICEFVGRQWPMHWVNPECHQRCQQHTKGQWFERNYDEAIWHITRVNMGDPFLGTELCGHFVLFHGLAWWTLWRNHLLSCRCIPNLASSFLGIDSYLLIRKIFLFFLAALACLSPVLWHLIPFYNFLHNQILNILFFYMWRRAVW